MSGYLSDPNSTFAQLKNRKTHRQQNQAAMEMPGFSQLQGLYNQSRGQQNPDYMNQFSEMVDPMSFLQGSGLIGEGGSYSPVGVDELRDFGEGAYELFDQFKPGMEYLAENQGISDAELNNMLAESSTGYAGNVSNYDQQMQQQMGRMGIDPTSGAYADLAGERAMQNAQGLSGLQQQVRSNARDQDWKQRMEAAGVGLNMGQAGTDAMGRVAGAYGDALGNVTDLYGNYMNTLGGLAGVDEQGRQANQSYRAGLASQMTGARPALDQTFYGRYQPQASWSQMADPAGEAAMGSQGGSYFGLNGGR